MKEPLGDRQRLEHILKAADRLLTEFGTLEQLPTEDGDIRFWAFVKLVEIIGEAAYNMSAEFKTAHPAITWRRIEATRHVMVHEYDSIDDAILWHIIREDVPVLRTQIINLLDLLPA